MADGSVGQASGDSLAVSGLTIVRPDGELLLNDVSLEVGPAELVLLVGPSGSGKSTLLLLLGGLLDTGPNGWLVSGQLNCSGRSFNLANEQSDVGGVVFQSYALFDDLDAQENLRIALDHAPRALAGLSEELAEMLADIDPHQTISSCSGGQRQRLAIARTVLANQPVLLFDEPNSGLDIVSSLRLVELICGLCRTMGKPALITVHHFEELLPLADRVLVIDPHTGQLLDTPPDTAAVEGRLEAASELPARRNAIPGPTPVGNPERTGSPAPAGVSTIGPTALAARTPTPLDVVRPRAGAGVFVSTGSPGAAERRWRLRAAGRSPALWFARYVSLYFWLLCASPVMLLYMASGACIIGFVTIWFGFNYYSFGGLLRSLLHDETLVGLGAVQSRVAIPLIANLLFVARNSAVIAADVGNRVVSSQFQAMANLNIPGRAYVFSSILISMVVGSAVFLVLSLLLGGWTAQETWHVHFPTQYRDLFRTQFFRQVLSPGGWPLPAMGWVVVKTTVSALLAAVSSILIALGPKPSSQAVNRSVANAIVIGVILTLMVHATISIMTTR
jgi:ABC-type multidrug transport system ATPase subunit/ABC-type transporter Mla maintaining outer membrane lipid asymmetry permease subunit MlaE